MNGVYDLGGVQGFGPIESSNSGEESGLGHFHEDWEKRILGMALWVVGSGMPLEYMRYCRERQFPKNYFDRSYYETWLYGLVLALIEQGEVTAEEMIRRGLITQEELDMAISLRQDALAGPSILQAREMTPPQFKVGDAVRTIVQRPSGHTRETRYSRGMMGVIEHVYDGNDVGEIEARTFADARGTSLEKIERPLYTVRFRGSELWGDFAEDNTYVNVNMWEDYLEPAA
ncbi:MAG: nitrile hydratase subunit beta [Anaerolineales bacterium]|nr:nitrile hydratase subunit beta [Anaerolineales bacterium]